MSSTRKNVAFAANSHLKRKSSGKASGCVVETGDEGVSPAKKSKRSNNRNEETTKGEEVLIEMDGKKSNRSQIVV